MSTGRQARTPWTPTGVRGLNQRQAPNLASLAEVHGTPLLVLDAEKVQGQVQRFLEALSKGPPGSRLFYASKALSLTGLVSRVAAMGAGIEVISPGELLTAQRAGVAPERILMNGSPKPQQEIEYAATAGVTTFVLDAFEEIAHLERAMKARRLRAKVLVRFTPDEAPDAHPYVQTAGRTSKFGFLEAEVHEAVERLQSSSHLDFLGLHTHVASNLMDMDALRTAGDLAIRVLMALRETRGVTPKVLDMGGGFASGTEQERPDVKGLVQDLTTRLKSAFGPDAPALWFEPGRSIVEEAGTLVYRVLSVKRRPERDVLILDGGMGDNIRPALYGARYSILPVDGGPGDRPYTVYGRYCESGDRIGEAILPDMKEGDLVQVVRAGAYTYSMASNYNRVGRPAVIWVEGNTAQLLSRREEADDLVALDIPGAEEGLPARSLA